MSQINHDECWIPARDTPNSDRQVIIWTKKPNMPKGTTVINRHLDTGGAYYDPNGKTWFHSDGSVAKGVTHWMEMPGKPRNP
jgi:uncharacterized protein DUF551